MDCDAVESRLAEALGDELAPDVRKALREHIATCATCRAEYESLRSTVDTMRSLEAPRRVAVRREGHRLVIGEFGASPVEPHRRPAPSLFRFAASLFLAFSLGYGVHAALTLRDAFRDAGAPHAEQLPPDLPDVAGEPALTAARPPSSPQEPVTGLVSGEAIAAQSLEGMLRRAHLRNPSRSALAKCLIAVSRGGR